MPIDRPGVIKSLLPVKGMDQEGAIIFFYHTNIDQGGEWSSAEL